MAGASQADGGADRCSAGVTYMHHLRNYKVRPDEFRQRVRRFPRDALLRGIAHLAAQESLGRKTPQGIRADNRSFIREGHLFQLAGICVTHCNNHRDTPVDDDAVGDLLNGLYNVWSPELDGARGEEAWQRVLSRLAYQQMPYQMSPGSRWRGACACSATTPDSGSRCSRMGDGRRFLGSRWRSS